MRLFLSVAFVAALFPASHGATTEQLRQWILSNRKSLPVGENGESDLAGTILRLFGFGQDKTTEEPTTSTTAAPTTTLNRDVCPFSAEPLLLANDYAYCRPSSIGDCPVGFLCDQSFVLGRSICCKDIRRGLVTHRPAPLRPSSVRPPFSWNTVTPTQAPLAARLTSTSATKKAPWYIKDRTSWPTAYNRVTPDTPTSSTTEEPSTTTEEPMTTPTTTLPSTTEAPTSTTTTAAEEATTQPRANPWARLWTSTAPPKNFVNVTVLQAGSVRPLKDGQAETVSAITLVNDNGYVVLIDTGSSSDTERLLHSLSKESVTLDQISTVVITHGSPGHMGNMNFFAQKPILFHSMEYVGRHVTPTELKERPYRKLSTNVEVWKTPGHTQHDLTVLVHNVAGYGSMAIVGDLIPSEQLISEKRDVMAEEGVWDAAIKRQNANLIVCMADWIVPGHGQPFRVLPHYRQKAGCTRLLAQRHLSNQV